MHIALAYSETADPVNAFKTANEWLTDAV